MLHWLHLHVTAPLREDGSYGSRRNCWASLAPSVSPFQWSRIAVSFSAIHWLTTCKSPAVKYHDDDELPLVAVNSCSRFEPPLLGDVFSGLSDSRGRSG